VSGVGGDAVGCVRSDGVAEGDVFVQVVVVEHGDGVVVQASCGEAVVVGVDGGDAPAVAIAHGDLLSGGVTSRLRDAITAAARGGGVRVHVVAAKGLSRVHAECGHENPADDRYVSPPVICEGCGAEYDPDESATKLMLRAADAL
jgi:hypothetical protein